MSIANRIDALLQARGMTQKDLAMKMGKKEAEISRWLSGRHGFTTASLTKISNALGEPIVEVKTVNPSNYIFIPVKMCKKNY